MKKKTFVLNTIILTITSILLRTTGISFRVFISNKIGAEGIGLYQLIFSVFILFATFANSGVSVAVTRLVSEALGKGKNINNILKKSIFLCLIFSISATLLLFYFSKTIATVFLRDDRCIFPIKVLAFSLPFISVSAVFSGFFLAKRNAYKSAARQIAEEIVQIFTVVFIIDYFAPKGLEYSCLALVIGIVVSEVVACAFAYFLYRGEIKKENPYNNQKGIIRKLLSISLPIALTSYLRSIFSTIENILIPMGFSKSGQSKEDSLATFGMITGMAMPVLFFPNAFLFAFSSLLIPEISEANALNQKRRVSYTISRVFQVTVLLSVLVCGIFLFFSDELATGIYNKGEIGFYISIISPLIPLMYLDNVVDGMLKGLNQQVYTLKVNIFDSVIRTALIYLSVPVLGVWGYIIVLYVSNILNPLLSIDRLIRVARVKINLSDWIIRPILLIFISGYAVKMLIKIIPIGLAFAISLVILLYLLLLKIFNCITSEDIKWAKGIFIK